MNTYNYMSTYTKVSIHSLKLCYMNSSFDLILIKGRNQDVILNIKLSHKIKHPKILLLPIHLQIYKVSKINYIQETVLLFIDKI